MSQHRVIDFHDDLGASFCATDLRPPEFLKTASFRETYELHDGDFALIIVDEDGKEHRKFACNDAGNTWLSLWYFENVESGLPEYAKVAAAENLATYAGIHEIDMEDMFPRTAALCSELGISPFRHRTWHGDGNHSEKVGAALPQTASSQFWERVNRTGVDPSWLQPPTPASLRRSQTPKVANLSAVGNLAGKVLANPWGRRAAGAATGAALGGVGSATAAYMTGGDTGKAFRRGAVVGGIGGLGVGHASTMGMQVPPKVASSPYRLDERRVLVKSASCAPIPTVKEASAPSILEKVAEADRRWEDLNPWERRVVALTLAAEEPGFGEFPAKVASYMGEEIHPNILDNMRWRATRVARSDEDAENYLRVGAMAKVGSLDLEDAVEAVFLLDEKNGVVVQNGYGPSLPDPYLAVYAGLKKEAMWAWTRGDAYINEHQLRSYVGTAAAKIQMGELFTDDLIDKFRKDPIKTFESLPSEQKKVIARMTSSTSGLITGSFRA